MPTLNSATRGLCFRPVIPASNWHGRRDGDYWMQIHAPEAPENGITFSELPEEGKDTASKFRVCVPAKSLIRFGALKPEESHENAYPIDSNDYAMCDLGGSRKSMHDRGAYDPLEDNRLWRNFLEGRPYSAKAHKLFTEYGFLYDCDRRELSRVWTTKNYSEPILYAEHVQLWCAEFDRLQLAKDMWSIMCNEEYEDEKMKILLHDIVAEFYLNERGHWTGPKDLIWYLGMPDDYETLLHTDWQNDLLEYLPNASTLDYRYLLYGLVEFGIGKVETKLITNNDGSLTTKLIPQCLAGAVWIQFSNYMTEDSKILTCICCQKPFIRLRGKHRDALYCSNACKQKAWRNSPEQKAKRQERDQP